MMNGPSLGFNMMFNAVFFIIIIGFILFFGLIIVRIIQGANQWSRNNASPILTVDATVVTKRSDVNYSHHDTGTNNMNHTSHTTYYVTFEVASGDRMEFQIRDTEYGLLVERDRGKLTFQGTRYMGFERNRD